MDEKKENSASNLEGNGDMGTSENSKDLKNPVNRGSKSDTQENDGAVAMTRNPTDRAAAPLGAKRDVTGSDFDGQVSR